MPARKSSTLKVLNSTGHAGKYFDEPALESVVLSPPSSLSPEAQQVWNDTARMLADAGISTQIDANILELYCETWVLWRRVSKDLEAQGMTVIGPRGNPVLNPTFRAQSDLAGKLKQYMVELGMTPAGRVKVSSAPKKKDEKSGWDTL
jgi:P27 family predicted phage terminase small subunit